MTEAYRPETGRAQVTPIEEINNPYEINGLAILTDTTHKDGVFSSIDLTFKLDGAMPSAILGDSGFPVALYDGVLVAKSDGIALVVLPDLIDHQTEEKTDEIRMVDLVQGELLSVPAIKSPEEVKLARRMANQRRDDRLGDWATDAPSGPRNHVPYEEYSN